MEAFKNWLEHKGIASNTLNCVIKHLSKHCPQSSPSNQWCPSFALLTNSNLHYDTRKETKDSVSKIFRNQLKKQTHYINTRHIKEYAKYTEMRHLGFCILLIISIATQEMPIIWRNHMISVIHMAIHKHMNWCKFCHILNGLCMDILKSKEMDGLETLGLGCLMWVLSLVGYTSIK